VFRRLFQVAGVGVGRIQAQGFADVADGFVLPAADLLQDNAEVVVDFGIGRVQAQRFY
jgi:hypothetical protein